MSNLEHILWYFLHIQLMAEVTTLDLYLLPGNKSRYVGPSHLQDNLVRTIHN